MKGGNKWVVWIIDQGVEDRAEKNWKVWEAKLCKSKRIILGIISLFQDREDEEECMIMCMIKEYCIITKNHYAKWK